MPKADIGVTIGIDGEREFKKQVDDIKSSLKVLDSEMKIVTAEFGKNAESEEALVKQNEILERKTIELKNKLELETNALKNQVDATDEANDRSKQLQIQVNNTTAELAKIESQMKKNDKALEDLAKGEEEVGEEAEESADKLDENTKANKDAVEAEEKHTNSLGKVAVALGAMAAAAGTAAIALAKNVISSFGELEQNLGGAESVFGDYANSIVESSNYAYRNLGVSSSEYLATANKIGALFQGTGVEQERSLELTTQAMQRAADMASVMGINTEDALNAITGAAKGNYTMMDNLGVAMNNTALESYAADKGFDKLFKDMTQAEKAEVAMQYFFENTEQYAGNFAKEAAGTVQGALGMFNSAKENLIAGLGNADADIGMLAQQMMFSISKVVENIVPIISNIAAALPGVIQSLIPAIQTILPKLIDTGMELFNSVLTGILQVIPQLSDVAVQIITKLTESLLTQLPTLIEGAVAIILALVAGLTDVLPELVPVAVEAVLTIVDALVSNVDKLVDGAIAIIFALAHGLIASLPTLIEQAPVIVQKLVNALVDNAPKLLKSALQLIQQLANGLIHYLPEIGNAVGEIIRTILQGFVDAYYKFKEMGGNIIKGIIEGFNGWADWAWRQIKGFFNNVLDNIKDFLGIHSPSTVFAKLGEYSAMGFGEGFDEEFAEVSEKVIGDLKDAYDKAYKTARSSIDKQAKLFDRFAAEVTEDTASVEQMLEIWAEQTENIDTYTRNLKKAAEYGIDQGLVESWSDGSAKSAAYLSTVIDKLEELGVTTEGLGEEAQKFVNDFNAAFKRTGEAKDSFAKTATDISGAADDIKDNVAAVKGVVAELQEQYNKTYDAAYNSIGGQVKLFDDFASKVSEETDSVEEMTELWATQAENLENYTENLRKATSYGIDKRLIESLSDGSAESAGYIATIVAKIEELGGATEDTAAFIEEFNTAFQQTQTAKDNFAETVADIKSDLVELVDFTEVQAEEFKTAGEAMIENMVEGLEDESSTLYDKVVDVVHTALYKANSAAWSLLPGSWANAGVISSLTGSGTRSAMAESVNALGMMNQGGSGDLVIVQEVNGREFSRAILPDFRLVSSQNPIIVNDF